MPTASWLDFKLGFRMLARYPSLTAVAVLAMAFGIAGGTTAVEIVKDQAFPPLPYRDAERIVSMHNVSTTTTRPDARALHHFATWRESLRSIEHVSALYRRERNLSLSNGPAAPAAEVAISASAFNLIRVAPLLGRGLSPSDEGPEAPAVAVIGYDLWRTRFGGEDDVVGRLVRLGGEQVTVIGVMPKDFSFFIPRESSTIPPSQDLWVPFRLRALDYAKGEGPAIAVFGQLGRNATPEIARAELTTLAARAAAESPDTHGHLKPQILSFPRAFRNAEGLGASAAVSLGTVFLASVMVVICGNVALLVFARAATREREIAVRNALGASRARIVAQLFAEALVLSAVAIVVGLFGATVALRWAMRVMGSMLQSQGLALPSWMGDTLSPTTIAYAVGLAVIGAVVCGVLPGLKVTGPSGQTSLQRLAGGGAVRLGGVWTAITVTQVALTAMLVPIAVAFGLQTWKLRVVDHHLPVAQYLAVRLGTDEYADAPTAGTAARVRFEQSYRLFERRLAEEPGVTGVTIASDLPGSVHDTRRFQVDALGDLAHSAWEHWAQVASVDPDFFDVMRVPIITGRNFSLADAGTEQRAVIVNESFVREILRGRNAVGQRLRYRGAVDREESLPWYTIVGVTRDLAMTIDPTVPHTAGIYHVLQPRTLSSIQMAVRVAGEPAAFAGRVREIAAAVAPSLRLQRVLPLDQAAQSQLITYDATFRVIVLAGALAILLTNAGIYAVISFTVARRTREIGVRVALGAEPRQVVAVVLSRTARHVAIGVLIGTGLGVLLASAFAEGSLRPTALQGGALLLTYLCGMIGVCLLACVVPTHRALAIEPTQALATDG